MAVRPLNSGLDAFHARILEGSVAEFKGLTANAADPQAQVRDIGFMLMLMQRLICMNPLRA